MMVQNPEHLIPAMAEAGADNIGVHVEATPHIHRALQLIKNAGKDAEVVINPGTPVEMIKPVLHMVDQVLVMTVNPGFGGQKFLPETVAKIAELDAIKKANGYDFDIEIDGGINNETVVDCYKLAPRLRLPVHTSTMPKTHWLAFKHCATLLNNQVN
mgnify:CR=1 FL=1